MLPEDNQIQRSPNIIVPNANTQPPAKRKLDFGNMDEDCGPVVAPAPGTIINDGDLNSSSLIGMEQLEDEDYAAAMEFGIVDRGGDLQPLPFIDNQVMGPGGDFSHSPYNMTHIVPPDVDSAEISDFINGNLFFCCYFFFYSWKVTFAYAIICHSDI